MPIYYTLHTLVYKHNNLLPLPESVEDRHCLMILGGTVAWTIIWIALNSIQTHPLWNALRSSFIAVLAADIFVMLYIWNRSKTIIKPPRQNVSRTSIKNTDDALNDYYRSIQKNVRKTSISSLKAKAAQEQELETMKTRTLAATNIQQWWKRRKTAPKEFHTILTAAS